MKTKTYYIRANNIHDAIEKFKKMQKSEVKDMSLRKPVGENLSNRLWSGEDEIMHLLERALTAFIKDPAHDEKVIEKAVMKSGNGEEVFEKLIAKDVPVDVHELGKENAAETYRRTFEWWPRRFARLLMKAKEAVSGEFTDAQKRALKSLAAVVSSFFSKEHLDEVIEAIEEDDGSLYNEEEVIEARSPKEKVTKKTVENIDLSSIISDSCKSKKGTHLFSIKKVK